MNIYVYICFCIHKHASTAATSCATRFFHVFVYSKRGRCLYSNIYTGRRPVPYVPAVQDVRSYKRNHTAEYLTFLTPSTHLCD